MTPLNILFQNAKKKNSSWIFSSKPIEIVWYGFDVSLIKTLGVFFKWLLSYIQIAFSKRKIN